MNKHISLDITDITIEIIWLLTHLIISKNNDIFIKIIESELYKNIILYFFTENLDNDIIERILWFICNLLSSAKKMETFCDKKITEIIRISSQLLYYKEFQNCQNYILDILLELIYFEGDLVKKLLIEEGILNRLLKLSDELQNKITKQYIKENKDRYLDNILKIIDIIGYLIDNNDKELIEVNKLR
jgi:hypothetical protein